MLSCSVSDFILISSLAQCRTQVQFPVQSSDPVSCSCNNGSTGVLRLTETDSPREVAWEIYRLTNLAGKSKERCSHGDCLVLMCTLKSLKGPSESELSPVISMSSLFLGKTAAAGLGVKLENHHSQAALLCLEL